MIKIEDLKAGTKVFLHDGNETEFKFVSYDAESDMAILRSADSKLHVVLASWVSLPSIGTLDGRPVYVGSVVYRKQTSGDKPLTVSGLTECGGFFCLNPRGTEFVDNRRGYLSWTPPYITQFYGYFVGDSVALTTSFEQAMKYIRVPGSDCYFDGQKEQIIPGWFVDRAWQVDYWLPWNPLEDNDAAFKLAVDHGIAIKFHENSPPELHLPRQCAIASDGSGRYWAEEAKPDRYAAMRRAIVRTVANDVSNG